MKRGLWPALLALSTSGCWASSDAMVELDHPRVDSPGPAEATVVFIRPASTAPDTVVTLFTSSGDFIGDSLADSCFSRTMSPGRHTFVGVGPNVSVMSADLARKKTYFVEVAVNTGVLSVRSHMFAVHRAEGDALGKLGRWLADCDFYEVDPDVGQARLDRDHERMVEQIFRAQLALTKYPPKEVARRTLFIEDGR
ncbi:MAG: hypothetical protein JNK04_06460 [Myxococcales bacterium]|nr:hypothetical protein [Myxococcales bacterium]